VSVRELVGKLVEISGREIEPEIEGSGVPPGEIDRQYLDSTAISSELGWSPRYDLDEGLRETWAWYERTFAAA
jgi:CDP-glucose 4,6-dehydratase